MMRINRKMTRKKPFRNSVYGLVFLTTLSALVSGCTSVEKAADIGTTLGVATGMIDESHAESIKKTSTVVARSFQEITPEQEYYIGRAVGAVVLQKYRPYEKLLICLTSNILDDGFAFILT